MGGFNVKLIGGPADGVIYWLPSLDPEVEITQADLPIVPTGTGLDNAIHVETCQYTLMPFSAAGGAFLYLPFLDSED